MRSKQRSGTKRPRAAEDGDVQRQPDGTLVFVDHPEFAPNLSPRDVMARGAFGGAYWRPIASAVTGKLHRDEHLEIAALAGLSPDLLCRAVADPEHVNHYGVKAGTSLADWEAKGWIRACDPYGWFQWYARFAEGRRSEDDERQIQRWCNFAGPKGRFRRQLINKVAAAGARFDDASISPVIRQGLLHWGYELTAADCGQ